VADIDQVAAKITEHGRRARHAYWDDLDLHAAVAVAGQGIELADRWLASASAGAVRPILQALRAVAYDLGSFTWPGWDVAGITISDRHLHVGSEAARRCLALTHELGLTGLPLSRAQWLVGAHQLAAGDLDDAQASFILAGTEAASAGSRAEALLAEGYGAIIDMRIGAAAGGGRLDEVLAAIIQEEDGADLQPQLQTARRVFAP
jgi:hypothetical protein